MSNRYRVFDRKDVGRILYALKAKPAKSEIDRLRERLADYDPVDLLTLGAAMGTNWKLPQWEQHLSHEELKQRTAWLHEELARVHRAHARRSKKIVDWNKPDVFETTWLNRKKLPRVICENCGRKFFAPRADAKTFSPACRVALHRKRQALNRPHEPADLSNTVRQILVAVAELSREQAACDSGPRAHYGAARSCVTENRHRISGIRGRR